MEQIDAHRVHFMTVSAADAGQRVDNFIRKYHPALPKSRIYQMLRKGEVRRNKKRVKPTDKICAGDVIRLPPIINAQRADVAIPIYWQKRIEAAVLYEDDHFLILNKPAGIVVHGGSGHEFGVIDVVRSIWGENYAELAHRLDGDTSGVLVLGKHRQALNAFQTAMNEGTVEKRYWALVDGVWTREEAEVVVHLTKAPLNVREKMQVSELENAQFARTWFYVLQRWQDATLMEAVLDTGRTHQIRVSAAHCQHAIAGDKKYGKREFNDLVRKKGFHGLFLHAREIKFCYQNQTIHVMAPLTEAMQQLLEHWTQE
ncbi:RluA family pseudouridine synthase [Dichelobacter nodosus]|uniref:Pseudouridine synthase n=1 Tax=Dichelobacter nodosus (strain VCS1703A) TaxID=246195 RepID=A5EXY5_DICNV|nr:RluA family pseudouridine synthase [Dichelobacter nodosus]ABQ13195.1 ribosomal large subunit pseudouridine synthase, RluC [Dichelobacter nodosus VCS1703A]KNZ39238.1 pseudouridine synthase [Dichelobacter nodosus]